MRRYDFVKDIARLELLRAEDAADDGFAIALTNDPNYWPGGDRERVADAAFRLGEGRALEGALQWAAHTGAGTMRGRESVIALAGRYEIGCATSASSAAGATERFVIWLSPCHRLGPSPCGCHSQWPGPGRSLRATTRLS